MINKFLAIFFTLVLCGMSTMSSAGVVADLYEAKVSITDQSSNSQRQARRQAFREVLVKISGNRQILTSRVMRAEINKASSYLLSYRYESEQNQLFYIAEFDRQRVDKLVRANDFPLWGARRPETLVWFVVQPENSIERNLISETPASLLVEEAKKVAKVRGIEISFPLLDLTDIQTVNVYDVWGGFVQNIVEGSQRYGADIVFSARLYFVDVEDVINEEQLPLRGASWVADWSLVNDDEVQTGSLYGESEEDLSRLLIHELTDKLGETYAVSIQDADLQKVNITITNIDNLASYENVRAFLSSLSVVARATHVSQQNTMATFELELLGSDSDLRNAFRLDEKIRSETDDFGVAVEEHRYIWNP